MAFVMSRMITRRYPCRPDGGLLLRKDERKLWAKVALIRGPESADDLIEALRLRCGKGMTEDELEKAIYDLGKSTER